MSEEARRSSSVRHACGRVGQGGAELTRRSRTCSRRPACDEQSLRTRRTRSSTSSGPTLGAASVLAAQGDTAGAAALTMTGAGVGAAPLALVGVASRVVARWRGAALSGGKTLKTVMGLLLVVLGAAILSRPDRPIEAVLAAASPDWLVRLTTSF